MVPKTTPQKAFFDPKNVIFPDCPILTSVGGTWDRNSGERLSDGLAEGGLFSEGVLRRGRVLILEGSQKRLLEGVPEGNKNATSESTTAFSCARYTNSLCGQVQLAWPRSLFQL